MNWFNGCSLRGKILLIVGIASFLCAAISITGFLYFDREQLVNGIINKQRTIHTQLDAAKDFVATQGGLKATIERFQKNNKSADTLSDQDKSEILNQVPIVAAMRIGMKNQERDKYKFRVFSDEPRRKENLGTAEELEIQKTFEKDPALEELVVNDGTTVTMFRPVRLSESQGCLHCHGAPARSPWGNGTDILGLKMENWKDGKLHGVFAVSQKIDEVQAASVRGHFLSPATVLVLCIVAAAMASLLIAALLARRPISELNRIADALASSRKQVIDASQQGAVSSTKLSEASTQQAASLQQTMASIEEISSMVSQTAESANKVKIAVDANQLASDEGSRSVADMQKAIEEIRETNEQVLGQMETSNKEFAEIVKIIAEIGDKTKVINDIVFQTKLLSFNASVEAARAGENGKGFAVVAEEVGNLAQMSGNASKEISALLADSTMKVNAIVKQTTEKVEHLVETGKDKINVGQTTAESCREALIKIDENARIVVSMIAEITSASREQALGVQEINKAITQLDQVTQQNSAVAQESSTQAEELNSEASKLSDAVTALVTSVRGAGSNGFETVEHYGHSRSNVVSMENAPSRRVG